MNRLLSTLRCVTLPSLLLGALLQASAASNAPRPFEARYDLYYGGMHVADTEISLALEDGEWRWRTLTRARGIYAMFTRKRPFSETRFSVEGDTVLLHELRFSDYGDERHHETASFDWDSHSLDVKRKGKQWNLELGGGVYDYHSIHLLTAAMGRDNRQDSTIDFYRKGKLVKSSIAHIGRERVEVDGRKIEAEVYEQTITRSDSTVRYFYAADDPLLLLRVERREPDESPSVLELRAVNWGS